MKLFTKDINQKLFAQYRIGSNLNNQKVVAKIFNPYGEGRWYLLNSDPNDPDYLWAIVKMGDEVEIGSVSRRELESIRIKPFGLPLERDMYFNDRNAMEVLEGLEKGQTFAAGGMTAGRYYKDKSGKEFRYIGESQGKLLFNDGEKIINKSEEDFEDDSPKERGLFGFFEEGGEINFGEDLGDGFSVGNDVYITDSSSMYKGKTGFVSGLVGKDLLVTILDNGNERNIVVRKKGAEIINAPMAKGGIVTLYDDYDKDAGYIIEKENKYWTGKNWSDVKAYAESYKTKQEAEKKLKSTKMADGGMMNVGGISYSFEYKDNEGDTYQDNYDNIFEAKKAIKEIQNSGGRILETFKHRIEKDGTGTFVGRFEVGGMMAKGGMLEHGFNKGDKILEIYKGQGIVENSSGIIEVINTDYGTRFIIDLDETRPTGKKSMNMPIDKQLKSAKEYIDYVSEDKMADGGQVAKVGEPYDSMTKYQLEKELKKLNEKRDSLRYKYGSFESDEEVQNEKEIDKIITLLYGEDFSGKGQKYKYYDGGEMANGGSTPRTIKLTLSDKDSYDYTYKQDGATASITFGFGKEPFQYEVKKISKSLEPLKQDILDAFTIQGIKQHEYKGGFSEAIKHLDTKVVYEDKMAKGGQVEIGSEGMYRGGAAKVLKYDDKSKMYAIKYLNEDGQVEGNFVMARKDDFEYGFSDFNPKMAHGGKLVGKQKNLDVNKNGKLDAEDFKMLRKSKMAMGGKVKFEDKVKAIKESLLKRKKVSPKVQKDYGKTYSPKEAEESAKRIAASQRMKYELKKLKKGGKTIAQTPAPKKDRVFGSSKNKAGSASSKKTASNIELNESIVKTLGEKAKKYNEKHSNKVSTSTLKAVMRRGMGAFSTSHRPGMSRQGWGFARVNKFLLKKGGTKVKAAYVQDDDLL